jgi:hypothetical protein
MEACSWLSKDFVIKKIEYSIVNNACNDHLIIPGHNSLMKHDTQRKENDHHRIEQVPCVRVILCKTQIADIFPANGWIPESSVFKPKH